MTSSDLASTALALATPGPILAAALNESGVVIPIWVITTAVSAMVAVVGFLLKRALDGIDDQLQKLDAHTTTQIERQARLEERVSSLEELLKSSNDDDGES